MGTKTNITEWIKQADYESLLRLWRFERLDSPLFRGPAAALFVEAMNRKRWALSKEEEAAISKKVGWWKAPLMTCEECGGKGAIQAPDELSEQTGCPTCQGSGVLSLYAFLDGQGEEE